MSGLLSCKRHFFIGILWLTWTIPSLLFASEPNLSQLSEVYQTDLFSITSDTDAIDVFNKKLSAGLQLPKEHSRHKRKASSKDTPSAFNTNVVTFVVNLSASRLATSIQSMAQEEGVESIHSLTEQDGPAHQWILTKTLPPTMAKMGSFGTNMSNFFKSITSRPKRPRQFEAFAQYVDQHYPELTGSPESWVGMLEQGNTAEITKRLSEYWEQKPPQEDQTLIPLHEQDNTDVNRFAHYYSWTRLLPIFKAHLIALTIQAQTETIQRAKHSLTKIKKWHQDHSREQSKARLCGKWHWTVHNHLNHGDHKMIMYFGNQSQQPTNQPQPTEMKINGNTVYLLWKFPKGFQEDSLLLSNNDQRLEGTFTNTMGPYGSIMGKRMTTCKP